MDDLELNSRLEAQAAPPVPIAEPVPPSATDFTPARVVELVEQLRNDEAALRQREKQADDSLAVAHDLRLRYKELFDFAPDAYLVTDPSGLILETNHAASQLLGARKEFLEQKPLWFFILENCRRTFYIHLNELRHGLVTSCEWECVLKPYRQQTRDISLCPTVLRANNGELTAINWLLRDISSRTAVQRALWAEQYFNERLVDAAEAIILLTDGGGVILRASRFAGEMLAGGAANLQGMRWTRFLERPPERAQAEDLTYTALTGEIARGGVWSVLDVLGRRRYVDWSIRSLVADQGEVAYLVLGYDVTALHEAQQKALQAERLAAIGTMVTALAHESRNALQRTDACLERLRYRLKDQPEALDLVARAGEAQEQLGRLFEDIRVFAAPLRLRPEDCHLGELWREAWQHVHPMHPAKQGTLVENEACDLRVWGDRFRLIQVFRNLFDNSFAAAETAVEVRITAQELERGGRPVICLDICDNGSGMNAEARERIFSPFFSTRPHGTGLGMAIVRRILEAHGGQIDLLSSSPAGTEFRITLPRSTAP